MATVGRSLAAKFWVAWDGTNYVNEAANIVSVTGQSRFSAYGSGALTGRGVTDQMTVILANSDGRYSPLNSGSAIYSNISEGKAYHRPCYFEVSVTGSGGSYVRVFTGVIKIPKESGSAFGAMPTVTIDCRSLDELYLNKRVSTLQSTFLALNSAGATEADIITQWLSDAGIASTDVDDGLVTIPWAWMDDESPIEDMWAIAAAAGGRFYASADGIFKYENAQHLLFSPHTVSQQTYTQADYKKLSAWYDDADLYSDVTVEVSGRLVEGEDVLWEPEEDIFIPAGAVKAILAQFRYPAYSISAVNYSAASSGGRDLTASVTVTDSTYYAQRAEIELTNASSYGAYLDDVNITGRPIVGGPRQDETADVTASFWSGRTLRNRRISSNAYIQTAAHGQMVAQLLRDWLDTPKLMFRMEGALGVAGRRLGDRITINDSSVMSSSVDAIVTGIGFTYTNKGWWQNIDAIDATSLYPYAATDYFIVGTHTIGSKVVFY